MAKRRIDEKLVRELRENCLLAWAFATVALKRARTGGDARLLTFLTYTRSAARTALRNARRLDARLRRPAA